MAEAGGKRMPDVIMSHMLRLLALSAFALLIASCDRDSSDAASAMSPVFQPSVVEAKLLNFALAEPGMDSNCIDSVTATLERPDIWADALSFGDGRIEQHSDARYDEASKRWASAAPIRPHRLRLPATSRRPGKTPPCDWRVTFYPPYFDGDMAFVVADERHARNERPGGQLRFWIFRNRDNGWSQTASGQSSYGRPVT